MTPERIIVFCFGAIIGSISFNIIHSTDNLNNKPTIITERVEVKDTTWWPRHANEYNVVRYEFSDTTCSVVETLIERGETNER